MITMGGNVTLLNKYLLIVKYSLIFSKNKVWEDKI